MAIQRQQKERLVKELGNNFSQAKVSIFTDFTGMDVNSMTTLRRLIQESGGQYRVVKKTLLKRAIEADNIEGIDPLNLQGEIAIAFGFEDPVTTAKAIYTSFKTSEKPKILAGVMTGKALEATEVIELANLPTRDELLAKMVGSINAPISGLVNVLAGTLRSFVYALKAIQEVQTS